MQHKSLSSTDLDLLIKESLIIKKLNQTERQTILEYQDLGRNLDKIIVDKNFIKKYLQALKLFAKHKLHFHINEYLLPITISRSFSTFLLENVATNYWAKIVLRLVKSKVALGQHQEALDKIKLCLLTTYSDEATVLELKQLAEEIKKYLSKESKTENVDFQPPKNAFEAWQLMQEGIQTLIEKKNEKSIIEAFKKMSCVLKSDYKIDFLKFSTLDATNYFRSLVDIATKSLAVYQVDTHSKPKEKVTDVAGKFAKLLRAHITELPEILTTFDLISSLLKLQLICHIKNKDKKSAENIRNFLKNLEECKSKEKKRQQDVVKTNSAVSSHIEILKQHFEALKEVMDKFDYQYGGDALLISKAYQLMKKGITAYHSIKSSFKPGVPPIQIDFLMYAGTVAVLNAKDEESDELFKQAFFHINALNQINLEKINFDKNIFANYYYRYANFVISNYIRRKQYEKALQTIKEIKQNFNFSQYSELTLTQALIILLQKQVKESATPWFKNIYLRLKDKNSDKSAISQELMALIDLIKENAKTEQSTLRQASLLLCLCYFKLENYEAIVSFANDCHKFIEPAYLDNFRLYACFAFLLKKEPDFTEAGELYAKLNEKNHLSEVVIKDIQLRLLEKFEKDAFTLDFKKIKKLYQFVEFLNRLNPLESKDAERLAKYYLKMARLFADKHASYDSIQFLIEPSLVYGKTDPTVMQAIDSIKSITTKTNTFEEKDSQPEEDSTKEMVAYFNLEAKRLIDNPQTTYVSAQQLLSKMNTFSFKQDKHKSLSALNKSLRDLKKFVTQLQIDTEKTKTSEMKRDERERLRLKKQMKKFKNQELVESGRKITAHLKKSIDSLNSLINNDEKLSDEIDELDLLSERDQYAFEVNSYLATINELNLPIKKKKIVLQALALEIENLFKNYYQMIEDYRRDKILIKNKIATITLDEKKAFDSNKAELRFKEFFLKNLLPGKKTIELTPYEMKNFAPFKTEYHWLKQLMLNLSRLNIDAYICSSIVGLNLGIYYGVIESQDYNINDIDIFLDIKDSIQEQAAAVVLEEFGFKRKNQTSFYTSFNTLRMTESGKALPIDLTCKKLGYQSTNLSLLKRPELRFVQKGSVKTDELDLVIPLDDEIDIVIKKHSRLASLFLNRIFETDAPNLEVKEEYADENLRNFFSRTLKDYAWAKKIFGCKELGINAKRVLTEYNWIHEFFQKRFNNPHLRHSTYFEIFSFIKLGQLKSAKLHLTAFLAVAMEAHYRLAQPDLNIAPEVFKTAASTLLPFIMKVCRRLDKSDPLLNNKIYNAIRYAVERSNEFIPGAHFNLSKEVYPKFKPVISKPALQNLEKISRVEFERIWQVSYTKKTTRASIWKKPFKPTARVESQKILKKIEIV